MKSEKCKMQSAKWGLAFLFGSTCAFAQMPAAATPKPPAHTVAQLDKLQGALQVESGGKKRACELFDRLHVGDVLRTGAQGSAEVVYFGSGARYALLKGASARVGPRQLVWTAGPEPKALPSVASVAAQAPHSPGFSGRYAGSVQRGSDDPDRGPRGGRPQWGMRPGPWKFTWSGPIMGPSGEQDGLILKFRVLTADGQTKVWGHDLPATTLDVTVPRGKLAAGVVYRWSVRLFVSGNPDLADGGIVRMLTKEEVVRLKKLEDETERMLRSDPKDSVPHLLLGRMHEELGLYTESLAQYDAAQKLEPSEAVLKRVEAVRKVLGQIQAGK